MEEIMQDPPGMPADERMRPIELRTVREALGLSLQWLADHLINSRNRPVNIRSVQDWESGREPIPDQIRLQVEAIEERMAGYGRELVAALRDAADPAVVVYRTDGELTGARPDLDLPARAWRHIVYRAAQQVPGVGIVSPEDLDGTASTYLVTIAADGGMYTATVEDRARMVAFDADGDTVAEVFDRLTDAGFTGFPRDIDAWRRAGEGWTHRAVRRDPAPVDVDTVSAALERVGAGGLDVTMRPDAIVRVETASGHVSLGFDGWTDGRSWVTGTAYDGDSQAVATESGNDLDELVRALLPYLGVSEDASTT